MTARQYTDGPSFRFCTGKGQSLIEEISHIEILATERLRDGISYHSVHTGALALLQILLTEAKGELMSVTRESKQIPACPSPPKSPRCDAQEETR